MCQCGGNLKYIYAFFLFPFKIYLKTLQYNVRRRSGDGIGFCLVVSIYAL